VTSGAGREGRRRRTPWLPFRHLWAYLLILSSGRAVTNPGAVHSEPSSAAAIGRGRGAQRALADPGFRAYLEQSIERLNNTAFRGNAVEG
jgi:hypothetical protein